MAVSSTTIAGNSPYGVKTAFDSSGRWRRPRPLPADEPSAATDVRDSEPADARADELADELADERLARSLRDPVAPAHAPASALEQDLSVTDDSTGAAIRDQLLAELAEDAAPRGFRIAWDLLGSRDEAEDAVQEALARACEQRRRIRDPQAIRAWFYRVLTNHCMRILRRRRLRRLFFGAQKPADDIRPSSAREAGPDRQLAHSREVAQLLRVLDDLPAKQRTALLLRYGHELPVADIADMLGVRPATIKTHLVRGLRRLRKLMEQKS